MRADTLQAIDRGEKLLTALAKKTGKANEAMRDSTERLVEKVKKELERWERKYKKAKQSSK